MTALTDRISALLGDAREDLERAESERLALLFERQTKINAIKAEYQAKLDAIDGELAIMRRLERVINPAERKSPTPQINGKNGKKMWVPREDKRRAILAAMRQLNRKATNAEITEKSGISSETVRRALEYFRDSGEVIFAGTEKRGPADAKVYMLTDRNGANGAE